MKEIEDILEDIIKEALLVVEKQKIDIFTFCLYHDHESRAIAVCIDTKENSKRFLVESNAWKKKYFYEKLTEENIEELKLWNFESGRSFSLGDYSYKNIGRIKIDNLGSLGANLYNKNGQNC